MGKGGGSFTQGRDHEGGCGQDPTSLIVFHSQQVFSGWVF